MTINPNTITQEINRVEKKNNSWLNGVGLDRCSIMNFLTFQEKLIFFFISVVFVEVTLLQPLNPSGDVEQ
jgi:hypothetical protein